MSDPNVLYVVTAVVVLGLVAWVVVVWSRPATRGPQAIDATKSSLPDRSATGDRTVKPGGPNDS
jgi:hypothetical protein